MMILQCTEYSFTITINATQVGDYVYLCFCFMLLCNEFNMNHVLVYLFTLLYMFKIQNT